MPDAPEQSAAPLARKSGRGVMRVLQLIHSNEQGGVEALAAMIAGGLGAHAISVETRFLYPAFTAGRWTKVAGLLSAAALIVRHRPDCLIAYQPTASVLAGVAGWMCGVPLRIAHQTSMPGEVHPLVRALDAWVGARGFYTANIANSHATVAAFEDYPDAYKAGLRLIEHGLEPPKPRQSPLRYELRTC